MTTQLYVKRIFHIPLLTLTMLSAPAMADQVNLNNADVPPQKEATPSAKSEKSKMWETIAAGCGLVDKELEDFGMPSTERREFIREVATRIYIAIEEKGLMNQSDNSLTEFVNSYVGNVLSDLKKMNKV